MAVGDHHPKRKRIRLDPEFYAETGTQVFITIGVLHRRPVFLDRHLAGDCVTCLERQANQDDIGVRAYCFMPDHLHLLLRVDGITSTIDFVRNFKSRTTRIAWKHALTGAFWQRSHYDHIVRSEKDEARFMRYVLENPMRTGLVSEWRAYPFSGSFTDVFDDDSLWDTR